MENATENAGEDEGAPESMLARMLTPAHATPDDTHSPLTLEQLRGALTGYATRESHASVVLAQLRDALATRSPRETRAPLSPDPPPPGWAGTNPLRLADDHPLNRSLDFETIKQKKEQLRKKSPELALRDFNQHISAATGSEARGPCAHQLNNGEITITVEHNAENMANIHGPNNQNHEILHSAQDALEITELKTEQSMLKMQLLSQSNGYHVEAARAAPAPARARAASVVPDISITPRRRAAVELVAPRAASAPAAVGTPHATHACTPSAPVSTPVASTPTVAAAAAPPSAGVTAQADAGVDRNVESPYSDNQLLVEVQNTDKREEWEHIPDANRGAPSDIEADFTLGPSTGLKRKKQGPRPRLPEHAPPPPPPPARRPQRGARKTVLRGFKQKLQSVLQRVHGKTVNDEEVEALLVGPTYEKETLDEADLFQEFVQIAVTKVFKPVPCSRLLRAALRQPRAAVDAGACAAPAAFFQHLTKTTEVAFVSVETAACRPDDSPFRRHSFRGARSSLEEPAGAVRALHEHAERMRAARAALAQAAERLQRQLQVVQHMTLPAGKAGPPRAGLAVRLPADEAGPPRAGLAARLPVRTLQDFQQLEADLQASPALREELMNIYRAVVAAARSPGEGVQAGMELTLAPPADCHFSGTGRRYRGVAKPSYSATLPCACLRDAIREKFSDSEHLVKFKKRLSQWLCGHKGPQPRPEISSDAVTPTA